MRKFHSIAALCGDGLRPELQALFDRLAVDPYSELFVRSTGAVFGNCARAARHEFQNAEGPPGFLSSGH